MSGATFDRERHRAEKLRRLERENEMLRAHRAQLERLLAVALRVAVGKTGVDPLVLCRVLEELDRRAEEPPLEPAVRVLQETRP